jgi:hypothetical protein
MKKWKKQVVPLKSKPQVELLETQAEFVTSNDTMFLGFVGGYRAGKTYSLCHKAIYLASKNIGYRGALLEPTYGMLKRVLIPTMVEVLERIKLPYTYRATDPHGFILHFPDGDVEILLMGAENYQRVAGISLAWFGVDEFDLIDADVARDAWRMLVSRLTKANIMQGFVTSTPEGYKWMHEFFVEEMKNEDGTTKTDRRLIRARTQDNPYIDPAYVERMRSQYSEKQLEAYLNGFFVNLKTGSVYDEFDRVENHTDKTLADYPNHVLHIGIDFNVGKMASVISVVDKGIPYTLSEHYGAKNTESWIKEIKKAFPTRKIIVYPDSSGANASANADLSSIQLLKNANFVVKAAKANPRIDVRVSSVNAKIKNAKGERSWYVNTNKCPQLTKSLEQQTWDPSTGKPDKTSDLDHPPDALGYFITFNWNVLGKATVSAY